MPSFPSTQLNPSLVAYTTTFPDLWISQSETINLPDRVMPSSRWPELMNISTLAEYLDMSQNSVRNLIANGILPAATTAPSPRLKRWKRSVIDDSLPRISDRKSSDGPAMSDVLRTTQAHKKGGR